MATSYEYPIRDAAKMTDIEILAEAHELVECFLELLRAERVGNDILDTRTLPGSKASIENSIRLVIATEPRAEVRKRLASAGMVLAQFQPGIGARMSITPVSHASADARRSDDPLSATSQWLDIPLTTMMSDGERLKKIFVEAEAIAIRRFDVMTMRPPFREDGTYTWYGHH